MSDFVKPEDIFIGEELDSREAVLTFLSDKALALGMTDDANSLLNAFEDREAMGATGVQDGFAIPHAKCSCVVEPGILVVKLKDAVEWPSYDNQPVSIAIALLIPESQAAEKHLKLISETAVLLMKPDFREAIKKEDDPAAIAKLINEGLDR